MKQQTAEATLRAAVFPTRALAVLLFVGIADLIATAWLHSRGLIVELNPLMRPLIERSEWLFVVVKSLTLVLAWAVLAWYGRQNLGFVRKACTIGSIAYVLVWCAWFLYAA